MIRFHMLHDQVIRLCSIQHLCNICQPFFRKIHIHSIHYSDFLIFDHIRVVRHSIWHNILPFKQIYLMIINPNVNDIICHLHFVFLLIF